MKLSYPGALNFMGCVFLVACSSGDDSNDTGESDTPLTGTTDSVIVGEWDISRSRADASGNPKWDQDYLIVRADDTFAQYDYQDDEWGTGIGCYIKNEGQLIFEQPDNARYNFYYDNMTLGSVEISVVNGTTTAKSYTSNNPFEQALNTAPFTEADLQPLCTLAEIPHSEADTLASLPNAFKTRFPVYVTATCGPLNGASDVTALAGIWDVSTISGNLYDIIVTNDKRYLQISPSGEVTNYSIDKDSYANYEQCYRVEENAAFISAGQSTIMQGAEYQVTYYIDESCQQVTDDISLARVGDQSGLKDLLLVGGAGVDVISANNNALPVDVSRFPEVADLSSTEIASLNICTPNPGANN